MPDLVRAGCLRRYCAGSRVDHNNRGARREAVYIVPASVRAALHGRSIQATGYRPPMRDLTDARRAARRR